MAEKTTTSREDAVVQLMLAVFRVNGALLARGDELVAPLGLTSALWQLLGAVALAGKALSAPQIGEAMGVSRQNVLKQAARLVEAGLFVQTPNPRNGRSPLYALSASGRKAYDRAMALNRRWAASLTDGFTSASLGATVDVLERFEGRLGPPAQRRESAR